MIALVNSEKRIVFLLSARSMCTKVKLYYWTELLKQPAPADMNAIHSLMRERVLRPKTRSAQRDLEQVLQRPNYLRIAFVRDPLQRFVSACNHRTTVQRLGCRAQEPQEIVKWLIRYLKRKGEQADGHFAPQTRNITTNMLSRVQILKIEDNVIVKANELLTAHELPELSSRREQPVQTPYTVRLEHIRPQQRAFVRRYYARDYELLGYFF